MYAIATATIDDVGVIKQLAEDTWWEAYGDILELEQIRYMLDTLYAAENISRQIATGEQTYLLLTEDNVAVAFAAYSPYNNDGQAYKLHKLYCLPQTQGKGYGKVLINEVCKLAATAGAENLLLNVNRHNKALTFYEKMGFAILKEEDIAIGPYWMNDYVMQKPLK